MITLANYYMGRDETHPMELTAEVAYNSVETIRRVNTLLLRFGERRTVTSGWRPISVNESTPGAAKKSSHVLGLACDLEDSDGTLGQWCLDNIFELEEIGLWLEHPSKTKGWCHLQTVPPKSGNRVFYP